ATPLGGGDFGGGELVSNEPGEILDRAALHARGDFFRQQFEKQFAARHCESSAVIPGRRAAASPESIFQRPVFMDSGLSALPSPGMTSGGLHVFCVPASQASQHAFASARTRPI